MVGQSLTRIWLFQMSIVYNCIFYSIHRNGVRVHSIRDTSYKRIIHILLVRPTTIEVIIIRFIYEEGHVHRQSQVSKSAKRLVKSHRQSCVCENTYNESVKSCSKNSSCPFS